MSAKARVQQEIPAMDAADRDWRKGIKPSRLDFYSAYHCALGQVFGTFGDGRKKIMEAGYPVRTCNSGFYVQGTSRLGRLLDHQALKRAWAEAAKHPVAA